MTFIKALTTACMTLLVQNFCTLDDIASHEKELGIIWADVKPLGQGEPVPLPEECPGTLHADPIGSLSSSGPAIVLIACMKGDK